MIVYKILNIDNQKDSEPIVKAIEEFNKGKSAIWVPSEWVKVEGLGEFEPTVVIYVNSVSKSVKKEQIKDFLQEAYDNLGGEDFLKDENIFIPADLITIDVLRENKIINLNKNQEKPFYLFRIKTPTNMPPSKAFEMVEIVRNHYDSLDLSKEQKIFIPDSIVDVSVV